MFDAVGVTFGSLRDQTIPCYPCSWLILYTHFPNRSASFTVLSLCYTGNAHLSCPPSTSPLISDILFLEGCQSPVNCVCSVLMGHVCTAFSIQRGNGVCTDETGDVLIHETLRFAFHELISASGLFDVKNRDDARYQLYKSLSFSTYL
jgi:hypothetical protein